MIATTLFAAAACLLQAPHTSPIAAPPTIVLDAQFEEWAAISPTLTDPTDAPAAFIDLGEVRISHDDRFVHLLIDFGRTVNAQGLDGTAMMLLNADGDAATGESQHGLNGVDVIIDLSPASPKVPGKFEGVGLRSTTWQPNPAAPPEDPASKPLNPYDIGFAFAPTHASRRFEFRFERGATLPNTPPLFQGKRFVGKVVFRDLAGAVADETDIFTHELTKTQGSAATPQAAQPRDPLARAAGTHLRAMNWNVELGSLFAKPDPYKRTLAALKPDLILFQELADENTARQLGDFLQASFPPPGGRRWNVVFGGGGGDLRCAVASTFELEPSPNLALIAMPDRPDRSLRAAGAVVSLAAGQRLLAVSAHLKCCGRAGGPEDAQRQLEVQLIQQAVQSALASGSIDGVIIAGDLNLVGGREPLEMLAAGLDLDRTALAIADAYQIDGLSNATWSDPRQPFIPGRLDFILFTDATLELSHCFVYDSRDLSPQWLQVHAAQPTDTIEASDHFPVVADLRWNGAGQRGARRR